MYIVLNFTNSLKHLNKMSEIMNITGRIYCRRIKFTILKFVK